MTKTFDVKIQDCKVEFQQVLFRTPLKFGSAVINSICCATVCMTVKNNDGKIANGYGQTPLSVGWAWPSADLSFEYREEAMVNYCKTLADNWRSFNKTGHAMEIGYEFNEDLPKADMPHLAQLICNSAFDIALHDAYGNANNLPTYNTYNEKYMNKDLSYYYNDMAFKNLYPENFFVKDVPNNLPVWHLVGGKDLLTSAELTGNEPKDNWPVTLVEWIRRDGLTCLKIKLTGNDANWDLDRLLAVGKIAQAEGVKYLSPDFNCMVKDPKYVLDVLDKLYSIDKKTWEMILYVEQPFPYDLEANKIDVHQLADVKPLYMDESAHDWRFVKLGKELGWNGVALKVCKTQTGALLSACWAKANKMELMVQDLTNPGVAAIPHVQLAAHIGTIMGVECNAPQFYPAASLEFEKRHPGLYERRDGVVKLTNFSTTGFGFNKEDVE